MWGWMSGWGWTLMVLAMVGFWALIIAGIVLVARALSRPRDDGSAGPGKAQDALEILRERFARGEIDEEEYRRRRATLAG